MNMYEIMEALREDIEVPDIVQTKADEALEQIRKVCAEKQRERNENEQKRKKETGGLYCGGHFGNRRNMYRGHLSGD